ncbi:MAG: alkaline phosphatase family protein [Salinispira sp.]
MNFYRDFFAVPDNEIRIFILIDGFGMNLFEKLESEYGDASWFARHFTREMQSVYPSTTAVALTCLASLRGPGELGVSGWTTWLPEHKKLVNVLISRNPLAKYHRGTWDREIVSQTIQVESAIGHRGVYLVQPFPYIPQEYAAWASGGRQAQLLGYNAGKDWNNEKNPRHWRRVVSKLCTEMELGSLMYLYLPMVDSQSHISGWDSAETFERLRNIEDDLQKCIGSLEKQNKHCTIGITADHGLINIPREQQFPVEDATPWMQYLESSMSCESRNPVFHVIPGQEDSFRKHFSASREGAHFELHSPEELAARGYFGPEGISECARPRWGTFIGLAGTGACLRDFCKGHKVPQFVAYHGGDDPGERRVPLFSFTL